MLPLCRQVGLKEISLEYIGLFAYLVRAICHSVYDCSYTRKNAVRKIQYTKSKDFTHRLSEFVISGIKISKFSCKAMKQKMSSKS